MCGVSHLVTAAEVELEFHSTPGSWGQPRPLLLYRFAMLDEVIITKCLTNTRAMQNTR